MLTTSLTLFKPSMGRRGGKTGGKGGWGKVAESFHTKFSLFSKADEPSKEELKVLCLFLRFIKEEFNVSKFSFLS